MITRILFLGAFLILVTFVFTMYGLVPTHEVQGNSMAPTMRSGDMLEVIKYRGAPLRTGPEGDIILFDHNGEGHVKRVVASEGEQWNGSIVPTGHVAVKGDNPNSATLPYIPMESIRSVVVGVRYSRHWRRTEGDYVKLVKYDVAKAQPQEPIEVGGITVLRADVDISLSGTDMAVSGDATDYYKVGMVVIHTASNQLWEITSVGLDSTKLKNSSSPHSSTNPPGLTRFTAKSVEGRSPFSTASGGYVLLIRGDITSASVEDIVDRMTGPPKF